jgi:hypothetical protein
VDIPLEDLSREGREGYRALEAITMVEVLAAGMG